MRKNIYYALLGVLGGASLFACSDDEDVAPLVALKEARLTPAEQTISVSIVPENAYSLEANNAADSVAFDVPHEALQQATLELTTTVGVGIESYYNGELVQGPIVVDATKPVPIEVRGYGQSKHYTLRVYQEQVNKVGEEPRLKSTDMRKAGLNPNAYDYDMILFNDKFYAVTTSLNAETKLAEYQLYTSDNGIMWDEVPYTCKDKDGKDVTVGGRGARLAVANGRLYVLGGGRYDGTDKYGYGPELSWGTPTISNWRSFSTEDGSTFKVDTIGIGYAKQENGTLKRRTPTPMAYPVVTSYQDVLYITGGFNSQAFGMWQSGNQFACSKDGVNWDNVTTNGAVLSNLKHCAYFNFQGKLWVLGGFANFCSESNMNTKIYSTTNGVDWTLETDAPAFGTLSGMGVAATDKAVYLFGGETFVEGKRTISTKVYRSEDGKNWEEVATISEKYVSRRSPRVVVKDGVAYIFGGYQEPTSDSYGYPVDKTVLFDTYTMTLQ